MTAETPTAPSAFATARGLARLALARFAAVLGPVVGVVTPLGWIVAALAAGFGIAGAVLGWAEFGYVAATLAAGLLAALAFLVGRGRFGVGVELSPRRVVAGERAFGRLLVANSGRRRSSPTRFELPVGAGRAEFGIPGLDAGAVHEEVFAVPTARRAVLVAGPAVSVRGDPLGLVRRVLRWSDPIELFVHARTVRLRPSAAGLVRDLEGEATRAITNNDLAFHALRPYEPGDDRRYVHWRTTARTGRLMVRQFTETRRSQLVVVHHADAAGYTSEGEFSDDAFELGVSVLASIGLQVLREGTRLRIASGVADAASAPRGAAPALLEPRTATPTSMLDDVSRIEALPSRGSVRELVRAATRRGPAPTVLVVVVGASVPIADLRGVDALFSGDTRTVGVRIDPGASPALSRAGGLDVVTVGRLSDLPGLLEKVA